jgi:lipopolysaccharide export system permease protein
MPVFRRTTRYVLRLLFWPLMLVTISLTGIIWLMQALRFVDFIINRGLSVADFLYLTALILPSLLSLILPIAVLIAVVFTYHKLYTESELVVMQASGMSRMQIARPAMVAGIIVTAATYVFTLYLLPLANRQFEDMRDFLRDNYASVLLQEEVFNHPVEGMTVFIRERSDTGKLKGILVHDNRDPDTTITMMAEEATLVQTPSGPRFLLENGIRQEKRSGRLSWLNFASYSLDLSYYTKRNMNRAHGESEMFVSELLDDKHTGTASAAQFRAEAHERLVWPWSGFALSLLAVAILTEGQFIGLQNTLTKHSSFTPALYGFVGSIIVIALLLLCGWQQRIKNLAFFTRN